MRTLEGEALPIIQQAKHIYKYFEVRNINTSTQMEENQKEIEKSYEINISIELNLTTYHFRTYDEFRTHQNARQWIKTGSIVECMILKPHQVIKFCKSMTAKTRSMNIYHQHLSQVKTK